MRKCCRATNRRLIISAFVCACLFLGMSQCIPAPVPSACDDIAQLMDRQPDGPAFLASYPTAQPGPLKGAAYLYDNAVATIALVACGQPEKASRIADAIVYAQDHDRYWHDGRLRNAYQAGSSVAQGPVKLAGWWDVQQNRWLEDAYQVGSDSGNLAWTILALLAVDASTQNQKYRASAVSIANWLTRWRSERGPGGFTGGAFGEEPDPRSETWKSTEQNTDLAAVFLGLATTIKDNQWLDGAESAQNFVRAMWNSDCRCFYVGTTADGITPNRFLALDAQLLPLLALPGAAERYAGAFETATTKLSDGGGFSFAKVKGGMWTEGTAQAALFAELSDRTADATRFMAVVHSMRTADGSYYASSTPELSTGLALETDPTQIRKYFHVAHLGAAAWAALAEQKYNPFIRKSALP
jgi:hypothetical protein